MNIKCSPKHHNKLEIYLDSLSVKLSIIGLTETWLGENEALYDILQYTCINRFRSNKRGGGVTLAIKKEIPYKIKGEFFYNETEGLFIKIDK